MQSSESVQINTCNDEYKSKLKKLKQEIINLQKKRLDLEEILEDKEKDMNTLKTKVYSLEQTSHYIKEQNNVINLEIKNLKEKIVELKKIIENRKITSEFEEKLRIEL